MADRSEHSKNPVLARGTLRYYSSFGSRAGALLIDVILLVPCLWYAGLIHVPDGYEFGFQFTNVGLIATFLYFVALEGSPLRGSIGKVLTSQVVANEYGEPLTLMHTIGRNLAKFLTLMTLMVGFLTILFAKRGQALHDLLARTCVMTEHDGLTGRGDR